MHKLAEVICLFSSVFIYCFAIGIYAAIIPNFIEQKVCSVDVEPALDSLCNDTATVNEATDIITTRGIIRDVVPMFILLLGGSWRDATGQNKPLMYSAIVGEVIGVCVQLFAATWWSIPIWTASIVESVLYGLSGTSKLFFVAATCAIADKSTDDQRTTRLAFYEVAASAGICLSNGFSGYCLHFLGYKWFFTTVIALHLLTIILVAFSAEDKNRLSKDEKVTIFKKMKTVTKSRKNNKVIWLMLFSCIIINASAEAETNLYLYYLQLAFNFTVKETGLYTAFRLIFAVMCTMTLSPVFSNVLKWSDFQIGILSSLMTLIASISMVFAKSLVELITFALLDFLRVFLYALPMSVVTKCVKSDEVGIFVSLRFIGECMTPILVLYLYDRLFSATSHTMPGAFFIASAFIILLVLLSFCISSAIYQEPTENIENNPTDNNVAVNHESDVPQYSGFIERSSEST